MNILLTFKCDYFDGRIAAYVDRAVMLTYGNKELGDYVKERLQ